jgi:hypothetical protein
MKRLNRLVGDFQKKLLGEAYMHGVDPTNNDAYKRAETYIGVINRINLVFGKNYQSHELLEQGELSSQEFLNHLQQHLPLKRDNL